MTSRILTPDVLRRQVLQYLQAAHRGDVSQEWLRGYLTAMFHAGAISIEECRQMIAGELEPFQLTPPDELSDEPAPSLDEAVGRQQPGRGRGEDDA